MRAAKNESKTAKRFSWEARTWKESLIFNAVRTDCDFSLPPVLHNFYVFMREKTLLQLSSPSRWQTNYFSCFIILPFVMSTCMPLTFKRFWLSRRLINYQPSILTRHQYQRTRNVLKIKAASDFLLILHHPTRLHLAQLNASGENQKTINYAVVSFRTPNCFIKPPHMFPLIAVLRIG